MKKLLALAALALSACATTPPPPPVAQAAEAAQAAPQEARAPVTILISIDGFRPDYLGRGVTPNLSRLAAEGVTGPMHPSFPSKTFPNHYTLVTGLRPDHNGIIANKMEDARRPGEVFTMASDDPFWWNDAEPIWVAAEKAGIRTATMFWPGANVAIGGKRADTWPNALTGGVRPDDWQQYNEAVTGTQRVNGVLDWLRRPAAIRPAFLTLYFDTVDTAGHRFGPGDARTTVAVAEVDAQIGDLLRGLATLGQPANLVIVADHGMAETSSTRTIALDRVADPADYRIVESGPYAALAAIPGHEAALEKRLLRRADHLRCWRKAEIPARLAYGKNPRVPPYLCLADDGWTIAASTPKEASSGGSHGYDNMADDMTALFVASGPAFARGRTVAAFDNVDIQPLLASVLGIEPGAGDGTLGTWNAVKR
jgi:predicted AlkP superfamily pyrophosphatase or phosphodiesterase